MAILIIIKSEKMENNSQRRENTSRLGYLAAAVLGVAAGLLAKSIYDDIQETVKYEDEW